EAGKIDLHPAAVSISDTLEGLINLLKPQAEKRKLEMRLKVDRDLPVIESDPGKVQQILFNFLSNALKFSPQAGMITVEAGLAGGAGGSGEAATESSGGASGGGGASGVEPQIRISVTDQGPGIALEDHARVFEKFVQLDVSVTREYGGTGLGLTISRDLAKLLGGRIELDSDLGRGATFSLVLPVRIKAKTTPLMPSATEGARA
ncbi:MAG: hypothetical protein IT442_13945, partial [Phycisphaeraceae bacterium]|nr:hypothetical protein [Phycisphaeraceae bacterium]